jgi:hypothetical protein
MTLKYGDTYLAAYGAVADTAAAEAALQAALVLGSYSYSAEIDLYFGDVKVADTSDLSDKPEITDLFTYSNGDLNATAAWLAQTSIDVAGNKVNIASDAAQYATHDDVAFPSSATNIYVQCEVINALGSGQKAVNLELRRSANTAASSTSERAYARFNSTLGEYEILTRAEAGAETTQATSSGATVPTTPYTLRFQAIGTNYSVLVNGTEVLTASIPDGTVSFSNQYTGFHTFQASGSEIDDFKAGTMSKGDVELIDGTIRVDRFSKSRRSISALFKGEAGTTFSNSLRAYSNLLSLQLHVFININGNRFQVGVFVIDEVTHEQDGISYTISMTGNDRSTLVSNAKRGSIYKLNGDQNNGTAFWRYMRDHFPDVETVTETITGVTVVQYFPIDEDPWDGAIRLAESMGCETFFDRFGRCVLRTVPDPRLETAVVSYSDTGTTSIPFVTDPLSRQIATKEIYNGVIVQGEAPWLLFPICGSKWDTDPTSDVYYDPASPGASTVGPRPLVIKSSAVGTIAAATALAEMKFNEIQGNSNPLGWTSMVDPRRDAGDVVNVIATEVGINGKVVIDELTIPMTARGGMGVYGKAVSTVSPTTNIYGTATYGTAVYA